MKANIKIEWLRALRSGSYTQCRDQLTSENETQHCCLGVLCDIRRKLGYTYNYCDLEDKFDHEHSKKLILMNDEEKLSFLEIADWIEENV